MKRICACLLAMALLLSGCARSEPKQYTVTYMDLFDTVTTVIGSGGTQEAFLQNARRIHDELLRYHRLFDIYNSYEGISNLKTVNDSAGIAPVAVDPEILSLLKDCKTYYETTGGLVNMAMGSVLRLWHTARTEGLADPENAKLPDAAALAQAAEHTDINHVILDEEAGTVYLADGEMSLDVGATAKGWAAQRVAENAPAGMLISVGGNVCATGAKSDGSSWGVAIQNPEGNGYLQTIRLEKGAVVTSGDYQRVYTVAGRQYHHIIDPATSMPAGYWRSVTVVCQDSALADALSTALFLLPLTEGQALAEKSGAQVYWYSAAGEEFMTPGFREMTQKGA